jgi:hypothetical protein
VTTIAIKGKTSSSKPLFPKLSKHTCLMAKEGRKKVKSNTTSPPKYVTSDEDTLSNDNYDSSDDDNPLPSKLMKNSNAMIKGLMRQVGVRDELLEQQEELLVQCHIPKFSFRNVNQFSHKKLKIFKKKNSFILPKLIFILYLK